MYTITVIEGPHYLDGRVFKIPKNKYHLQRIIDSIKFEGAHCTVTFE
jgi:hypothetical protein